MGRGHFVGPEFVQLFCPSCDRQRMIRPKGWEIDRRKAKVSVPGIGSVHHYVDVCDPCKRKLWKKYYSDEKRDENKVIESFQEGKDLGDKSIEELL